MLKTMFFQFANLPDSIPVKFVPFLEVFVKTSENIMCVRFYPHTHWCDNMNDLLELVQNDKIKIEKISFY